MRKIRFGKKKKEEKVDEAPFEIIKEPPKTREQIEQEEIRTEIKKALSKIKKEKYTDYTRVTFWFAIMGIVGVVMAYNGLVEYHMDSISFILLLFGMSCFLPLGLILGKLFLDPYSRCKIYRRLRGKNLGIVKFVHRGAKRTDIRIKNLDEDIIVQGTKLWVLRGDRIYYLDQFDGKIKQHNVNAGSMITSPSQVPEIYLDVETMQPLSFYKEQTISNPQQVGAVVLGYINAKIAEMTFMKKRTTFFYLIVIIVVAFNLVMTLAMYSELVGFD